MTLDKVHDFLSKGRKVIAFDVPGAPGTVVLENGETPAVKRGQASPPAHCTATFLPAYSQYALSSEVRKSWDAYTAQTQGYCRFDVPDRPSAGDCKFTVELGTVSFGVTAWLCWWGAKLGTQQAAPGGRADITVHGTKDAFDAITGSEEQGNVTRRMISDHYITFSSSDFVTQIGLKALAGSFGADAKVEGDACFGDLYVCGPSSVSPGDLRLSGKSGQTFGYLPDFTGAPKMTPADYDAMMRGTNHPELPSYNTKVPTQPFGVLPESPTALRGLAGVTHYAPPILGIGPSGPTYITLPGGTAIVRLQDPHAPLNETSSSGPYDPSLEKKPPVFGSPWGKDGLKSWTDPWSTWAGKAGPEPVVVGHDWRGDTHFTGRVTWTGTWILWPANQSTAGAPLTGRVGVDDPLNYSFPTTLAWDNHAVANASIGDLVPPGSLNGTAPDTVTSDAIGRILRESWKHQPSDRRFGFSLGFPSEQNVFGELRVRGATPPAALDSSITAGELRSDNPSFWTKALSAFNDTDTFSFNGTMSLGGDFNWTITEPPAVDATPTLPSFETGWTFSAPAAAYEAAPKFGQAVRTSAAGYLGSILGGGQ